MLAYRTIRWEDYSRHMELREADQPTTILLVEDDDDIAEPLLFGLRREGFAVLHAADGERGLDLAHGAQPDAVLLDVLLPGVDGFSVCRTLRRESAIPILMLTARGQELDRVMGLELGADDYIVKPFSFRELLARVRAALRRRQLDRDEQLAPGDQLCSGELVLDRRSRRVWRGERPVELTHREYELLLALMERCGQALSRQELLDRAWGERWVGDPRTLDVHVHWLREKLDGDPLAPEYIQTVRGYGYRFVDTATPNAAALVPHETARLAPDQSPDPGGVESGRSRPVDRLAPASNH